MGQKVSPIGMRVGVNRDYSGSWFDEKNYAKNVLEDLELRAIIAKLLPRKRIARVLISKDSKDLKIDIFTSLFGEVIGQKGENIEKVKNQLFPIAGNRKLTVNVIDVKKPDVEAPIIAEEMAIRVEKKEPYKRVISDLLKKAMKEGVRGIKIMISGRLDGNDIARTEWFSDGTVPLHTLKADIDYALCEAHTTYGRIGCKVWVYRAKENKSE